MLSALIVALTAIAAFRQLRHYRNANDIVVYLRLIDEMDSPALLEGRNSLSTVSQKTATDREYRERLTDPKFLPEEFRNVGALLRFLEHISVLVTKAKSPKTPCSPSTRTTSSRCGKSRPTILQRRVAFGPHTGRAFERRAMRAKRYIDSGQMEREYNTLERDPRDQHHR